MYKVFCQNLFVLFLLFSLSLSLCLSLNYSLSFSVFCSLSVSYLILYLLFGQCSLSVYMISIYHSFSFSPSFSLSLPFFKSLNPVYDFVIWIKWTLKSYLYFALIDIIHTPITHLPSPRVDRYYSHTNNSSTLP